MHIAILHYHLNRGGVTRVIANHVLALDLALIEAGERARVALLYDGHADGWEEMVPPGLEAIELEYCPVPGSGYDLENGAAADSLRLARSYHAALESIDFPADTVLHCHNHSIGKSLSLPGALRALAEDGYPLLLQIHDFAEDFRPLNYAACRRAFSSHSEAGLAKALYPTGTHVHYAYLNRRDGSILEDAGAAPDRLHFLPNPVTAVEPAHSDAASGRVHEALGISADDRLIVYPVRGIRRKNIGEAVLWSVLGREDARVVFTLPPETDDDVPSYLGWKAFAESEGLPCIWEVGNSDVVTFPEIMAASDRILNTSLAEGFGLVFLECWLSGRLLVGRDLPEITADFGDSGLRLDTVQPRLDVPLDRVGADDFRDMMLGTFRRTLDSYGAAWPDEADIERGLRAHAADGKVDFGSLDETLQRKIVARLWREPDLVREIHALNPWLEAAVSAPVEAHDEMITHNHEVVRQAYSLLACGRCLAGLYRTVASAARGPVTSLPQGERVLGSFLDLARFRPLRGLE